MVDDVLALNEDDASVILLKEPAQDPFINLESLSVAMIALIKGELLESDFSMCLGLLMSYREPDDPTQVLEHANKVRRSLINDEEYQRVPSPEPVVEQEEEDPYSVNNLEPEEAK